MSVWLKGLGRKSLQRLGLLFLLFLLFTQGLLVTSSSAVNDPVETDEPHHRLTGKKLLLISVPGLSFLEIGQGGEEVWPYLSSWLEQSTIGAMNIRTPARGLKDSYLTLGSGAMAVARLPLPPLHFDEMWLGEAAYDLYARYNGKRLDRSQLRADIIVSSIHALNDHNRKLAHGAKIGSLGRTLAEADIQRYVWGNSDSGKNVAHPSDPWNRYAPLLLMDDLGIVPYGDVSTRLLKTDVLRPFGVMTDYDQLLARMNEAVMSDADVVMVLELGDLERLYADRAHYGEERFQQMKATILSELDRFIGTWLQSSKDSNIATWVFSPKINPDASRLRLLLAPWIQFNVMQETSALLESKTTRQPGIVSNLDFAVSVLDYFHVPKSEEMIGFAVHRQETPEALQVLQNELSQIRKVYTVRPKIMYTFVSYEIIVLLVSLFFAFMPWKAAARWLRLPLISLLVAPAVMLLLGYLTQAAMNTMIILFILGTVGFVYLVGRLPIIPGLAVVGLLNSSVILLDGILLNALGMKRSILGYDPMYGARYYGLGNEFMGVLIGAVILLVSVGLHALGEQRVLQYRKGLAIGTGLLFIGVIYYIGSPSLGTNAGGAIAATVTFGIAWTRWFMGGWTRTIRWTRLLGVVFGFGVLSFIILWLFNLVFPWSQTQESHIGRAMRHLLAGRLDIIREIIARKLSMNLHLLGVSSWSKVLITCLFVMCVLIIRPKGVFRQWQELHPLLMVGYLANTIGAIIALAVNDSGIVAAATMIVFVAVPMLLFQVKKT